MTDKLKKGEITAAITYVFSLAFFLYLCFCLSGCGGGPHDLGPLCEAPEIAASSQYIVNGSPSTDRRATVKVVSDSGWCSGTIVGPHTVLTAAHCEGTVVFFEDGTRIEVGDGLRHPNYAFPHSDLYLLYSEVTFPEPYASLGDHSECVSLLAQGYGIGSNHELHEREVEHVYRDGQSIYGSESICNGDSGGPLYALDSDGAYTLVGVSSFGLNEPYECTGGAVGFVDLTLNDHITWIEEHLR